MDQPQLIEKLEKREEVLFKEGSLCLDFFNYEENKNKILEFLEPYKHTLDDICTDEEVKGLSIEPEIDEKGLMVENPTDFKFSIYNRISSTGVTENVKQEVM